MDTYYSRGVCLYDEGYELRGLCSRFYGVESAIFGPR